VDSTTAGAVLAAEPEASSNTEVGTEFKTIAHDWIELIAGILAL
jgi:hypothetical protein